MLIIHGDNISASRQFFLSQKKLHSNILEFSGDSLTFDQLIQALSAVDIFGNAPTLFVENFFSRRQSREKKKIIDFLNQQNIVFYDSRDVSSQLKLFDPKLIKYFAYPRQIYSFLESLSIKDLQICFKTDPPEMILGALARHLHNLILAKENCIHLPAWQSAKLKKQAGKFQLDQLIKLFQSLLEIDYRQKTSSSPLNLRQSLELWCIGI